MSISSTRKFFWGIRNWFEDLFHKRPDLMPYADGYSLSGCHRCFRTWRWTTYHVTNCTWREDGRKDLPGPGCFPLCESCWSKLTPITRLPYYEELFQEWDESSKRLHYSTYPAEYYASMREAVLDGK